MVFDGFLDADTGIGQPLDVGIEGARHHMPGRFHATGEVGGAGFEHGGGRRDDVGHIGADLGLALIDHRRQRVLALGEGVGDFLRALHHRLVDLTGARFEGGVELLRAGVERLGAGLELANQRLAAFGQRPLDAAEARFEFRTQRARRAAQQRDHAMGAVVEQVGQRARQAVRGVGQLGDTGIEEAGESLAGGRKPVGDAIQARFDGIEDRRRAFINAVDQRVAGIVDRHRQLGRGVEDRVADDIAGRADLVAQRLVRAGDGSAHALGMRDDRLALAAQTVDQRTDAGLVLGIGAFDLADFAVDKRFELDGASERPLDAFAHGCHLAANGLADHHDAVLGKVFRLRQAEGDLGHGLRGDAHFLRAPDHGGERPEQDDRNDRGNRQADQFGTSEELVEGADLPDVGAEQKIGQAAGAGDPGQRDKGDHPVDGARRAPVEAVQQRLVVLLAVVIGGREAGGRCEAGRLPVARLDRAQFGRLGRGGLGSLGASRLGVVCRLRPLATALARQLVGCRRDLRFEVFHRRRHIEAAFVAGKVKVKRLFQFRGYVAVERLGRRWFLSHAFATLY
ncbi:hypothetical protein MPL1032_190028 [Mesorhizobium plurifarium]|uniref:Uncharacterized protein n=1 Tax=Mesorhizobium plurifarium TaxID=69974 RepID=A0A0K2VUG2_MESPL|nr:hypothetical protein MPL1032_190028 [Mesorhizobium plurifarium]